MKLNLDVCKSYFSCWDFTKFQQLLLNKKVIYSLAFRVSQVFIGIVTLLVIIHWLKPEEQGYYYIFSSFFVFQTMLQMGLAFSILQFTGHEFADISWSKTFVLMGPPEKIVYFQSFLKKCVLAYVVIAILSFSIMWPLGILFFQYSKQSVIAWELPWLFFCLANSVNILTLPFINVIEGSGLISKINQFKTIQNFLGSFAMWLCMIVGAPILSVAISIFVMAIYGMTWLVINTPDLLNKTFKPINKAMLHTIDWGKEIWPMQWRMTVSWLSSYSLIQIYTPIIFYYYDPIVAGKLGISIAICNILFLFSMAFISAYNPELCQLIAKKQWVHAKALFNKIFIYSLLLSGVLMAGVLIAMFIPFLDLMTKRFVTPSQMLLLFLGVLTSYAINAVAVFFRAFKREPLIWISLFGVLLNLMLAWQFGKLYAVNGIVLIYFLSNFLYGIPTVLVLWKRHNIIYGLT